MSVFYVNSFMATKTEKPVIHTQEIMINKLKHMGKKVINSQRQAAKERARKNYLQNNQKTTEWQS